MQTSRYRSTVAPTQAQLERFDVQMAELRERAAKTDERIETLLRDLAKLERHLTQVKLRLLAHAR